METNEQGIKLHEPKDLGYQGEDLHYTQRGVLYIEQVPVFIVDLHKFSDTLYAVVFDVEDRKAAYPRKKLKTEQRKLMPKFLKTTKLGSLFAAMSGSSGEEETIDVKEEERPLFMAPVLPDQICSITKTMQSAFFEREPDRLDTRFGGKERRMLRGRNTGAIIGLSAILWDKPKADVSSVVKSVKGTEDPMYFDLLQSKDMPNPLKEYYDNLE